MKHLQFEILHVRQPTMVAKLEKVWGEIFLLGFRDG